MFSQVVLALCFIGANCLVELPEKVEKWCHELYNYDVPDECEDGWILCRGHCYFISHDLTNWTVAEQDCLDRGAHLVSILSQGEQEFLSSQISDPFWIGLTDKEDERTWKWVDGSPVKFTNWHVHQPDNSFETGQDCGQSVEPTEEYKWTINDEGKRWDDAGCYYEGNKHACKKPTKTVHFTQPAQIQLGCSAFGNPTPQIEWKMNGDIISGKNQKTIQVADLVTSSIMISYAEASSGKYTCVASNTHSLVSSNVEYDLSNFCASAAGYIILGFFVGLFLFGTVGSLLCFYLHRKKVLIWCWSDNWKDAFPFVSK